MKVAALYDIHGNLPALEAVLEELEEVYPDLIVVGGDIVSGPFPAQTLERLQLLGERALYLRGNADREVVDAFDSQLQASNVSDEVRAVTFWVARQMEVPQRTFLADLPERITLHIEGLGDILFCHATPRNDEEIFTPLTPQIRLEEIFAGIAQPLVICGHTHVQFELQAGSAHVINAGSIGMPYADQPGAYWLLLSSEGCEFRRTAYDVEGAAQQIRLSDYPQAQEFAAENVLIVPTATEAIAFFENASRQG